MEIERKYKIHHLPEDYDKYPYKKIEQGYLCHNQTIRIRKSNEDYILTYKSKFGIEIKEEGSAIFNNEVELPLTKEAYDELLPKTDSNLIQKTRYVIPIADGLMAELDVFEGFLSGVIIVEVEFADEKASMEFTPPEWFGKELSSDKRFTNYSLSKLTSCEGLGI